MSSQSEALQQEHLLVSLAQPQTDYQVLKKSTCPPQDGPWTQDRISREVYPEKFLLSYCCHFLFNFIFCLSSRIWDPLALFRLICHRVVGLIFFAVLLTVADFSFNQSICVSDFLFHLLQASPQYLSLPFCSLIQSPHLWSQSQGWKPMAPPRRHWASVIKWSHTWLCVIFSTNALRQKCYFSWNFRCQVGFFFLLPRCNALTLDLVMTGSRNGFITAGSLQSFVI